MVGPVSSEGRRVTPKGRAGVMLSWARREKREELRGKGEGREKKRVRLLGAEKKRVGSQTIE